MQPKVILTDAILMQKAKDISQLLNIPNDNFKFSSAWLSKFITVFKILEPPPADHMSHRIFRKCFITCLYCKKLSTQHSIQ